MSSFTLCSRYQPLCVNINTSLTNHLTAQMQYFKVLQIIKLQCAVSAHLTLFFHSFSFLKDFHTVYV